MTFLIIDDARALAAHADSPPRRALTAPRPRRFHSCCMDEPTHANESGFWDQVADWILDSREADTAGLDDVSEAGLTDAEIEAMLRELRDDLDAP
jgi:hypothetical protein